MNALLRLSARGEALVAEMLRLSDHIPPLFTLADKTEKAAYEAVLLDFRRASRDLGPDQPASALPA